MKGVEYIMLEDKAYQIKAHCGSDDLGQKEKGSSRLISVPSDPVSQIRVDGGQVQPVIKRQQNVGDDEIAYEEAETGLHIGHVDAAYHTRNGNEGNSRKGGSDHSERNNIPGRTAVAAEERVIIGMTAGKAGYKQQYSEIEQYGQQNINSVHVIFLSANVLKIVEIA